MPEIVEHISLVIGMIGGIVILRGVLPGEDARRDESFLQRGADDRPFLP
jgi:hypothetical protein